MKKLFGFLVVAVLVWAALWSCGRGVQGPPRLPQVGPAATVNAVDAAATRIAEANSAATAVVMNATAAALEAEVTRLEAQLAATGTVTITTVITPVSPLATPTANSSTGDTLTSTVASSTSDSLATPTLTATAVVGSGAAPEPTPTPEASAGLPQIGACEPNKCHIQGFTGGLLVSNHGKTFGLFNTGKWLMVTIPDEEAASLEHPPCESKPEGLHPNVKWGFARAYCAFHGQGASLGDPLDEGGQITGQVYTSTPEGIEVDTQGRYGLGKLLIRPDGSWAFK